LPGTLLFEDRPQVVPDRRIVIDKQNANHAPPSPPSLPKCGCEFRLICAVQGLLPARLFPLLVINPVSG
jgi:hypothetical protein